MGEKEFIKTLFKQVTEFISYNKIPPDAKGSGAVFFSMDESKAEQIYRFYRLLTETNKVMNLTAITGEREFIVKHVIDSLAFGMYGFLRDKDISLIDIGTGAGFPGLVLKIFYPDLRVTLSDSVKKKLVFLDQVIRELDLKGVRTVHGRAEDLGRDERYREQFDAATSRAVANMSVLAEYCLPFVKKGGYFAAYKTAGAEGEIRGAEYGIRLLGGALVRSEPYKLRTAENKKPVRGDSDDLTVATDSISGPGGKRTLSGGSEGDMDRRLVLIEKIGHTPPEYPRKTGTPSRAPLAGNMNLNEGR